MASEGFWMTIWKEDLRAPSRDIINQMFYVVITVFLDSFSHLLLDRSLLSSWLRAVIYSTFEVLTLLALAQLAIPMAVRMIRSGFRSVRKK